MRRVKAVEDR